MSAAGDTCLEQKGDHWSGTFMAMASPCEVLMAVPDRQEARRLLDIAAPEAFRIERKFSRYRDDNIIYKINNAVGRPVRVDDELAGLLDFAQRCYDLSDGRFDVTSGVLRNVWKFDGSDRVPSKAKVKKQLRFVGWEKSRWTRPWFELPAGMEIDLGGIGKEYAVDRVAGLLRAETASSTLVNFGGDLFVSGLRPNGKPWQVGIENPNVPLDATGILELRRGGVATSGDAARFILKDGVRYSHVLDPRTGWPVIRAPRSVTVAAECCTEAGLLATLAMLHGEGAEEFLETQGVRHWCLR